MKIPNTSLLQTISSEELDRTIAIKIASCGILCITVVVFIARQIMKAVVFRSAALDDLLILLASLFAIGLSLTTFILASHGLGVFGYLTLERVDILMKGYYVSELLYVSAICLAKLSILVFFYNIVIVQRLHHQFVLCFGFLILAWSTASFFAVAFQCEVPRPWVTTTWRCFNTRIFWVVYCVIDVFSEVAIIMLAVTLVAYLKVQLSRKFAVVACFAPRVLVLGVALVRLIWLYPITASSDAQYRLWLPAILTQVHVCLSICTACIPYMVPFFKKIDGTLRRSHSTRSRNILLNDEHGHSRSSLWFRRHTKAKSLDSSDPGAVASIQYVRVSQTSPYLPTPRPLTSLSPPQLRTPPSTKASMRGLNIYIPHRDFRRQRSIDLGSPQTASSCALSPICTSPQPLLDRSFVPTRKVPSPPPRAHGPKRPTSSCYSSRASTHSSRRTQFFSLFPSQRSASRSPQPGQDSFAASSTVKASRSIRSQAVSGITRYPPALSPYSSSNYAAYPVGSFSRGQQFKPSPGMHLQTPPLTATNSGREVRPESVQNLTSPMGAAINDYFDTAVANDPPSHQAATRLIVMSTSSSNRGPISPSTYSPAPDSVLRNELFLPRDSLQMTRTLRSQMMPTLQDVKNSPHIAIGSSS